MFLGPEQNFFATYEDVELPFTELRENITYLVRDVWLQAAGRKTATFVFNGTQFGSPSDSLNIRLPDQGTLEVSEVLGGEFYCRYTDFSDKTWLETGSGSKLDQARNRAQLEPGSGSTPDQTGNCIERESRPNSKLDQPRN